MPEVTRTSYGSGDQTWLGSAHGIRNARSSVLDVSALTEATHYPDGYVPSGTPVDASDEGAVTPWADAEGAQLGFVLFDVPVNGTEDLNVSVLRHGLVKIDQLPQAFTVPATGSAAGFTFIDGSDG